MDQAKRIESHLFFASSVSPRSPRAFFPNSSPGPFFICTFWRFLSSLAGFPNNFRTTFNGTLEYFVGDNPGDGFAKKKLLDAKYSNRVDTELTAIQRYGRIAIAMGNVCLMEAVPNTDPDDPDYPEDKIVNVVVDKTFVFRKDDVGNVKLILHMSAQRNVRPGEKAVE